jgi:Tfp pilus assembly protein PilO
MKRRRIISLLIVAAVWVIATALTLKDDVTQTQPMATKQIEVKKAIIIKNRTAMTSVNTSYTRMSYTQ